MQGAHLLALNEGRLLEEPQDDGRACPPTCGSCPQRRAALGRAAGPDQVEVTATRAGALNEGRLLEEPQVYLPQGYYVAPVPSTKGGSWKSRRVLLPAFGGE